MRIIKKPLKRELYFFFQTQSLSMDKIIKNKKELQLVTSRSSCYGKSSEKVLYFVLFDQVWWCNIKWFSSYSKNYICKFMQANSWHHNYSTSMCPSESGNCRKEGKKLQKFKYLENEKSFLYEIKNIFHSFWRTIIGWKNKNLIKNSGHEL